MKKKPELWTQVWIETLMILKWLGLKERFYIASTEILRNLLESFEEDSGINEEILKEYLSIIKLRVEKTRSLERLRVTAKCIFSLWSLRVFEWNLFTNFITKMFNFDYPVLHIEIC